MKTKTKQNKKSQENNNDDDQQVNKRDTHTHIKSESK